MANNIAIPTTYIKQFPKCYFLFGSADPLCDEIIKFIDKLL